MFLRSAAILISILFFSSTSLAQTTTSTTGKFALVDKGEQAPFKGTLFDPVATAKIITDKKSIEDVGQEIFDLIVRVASGEKSKSEIQGLGDLEFVPWQIGATM